MADLEKDAVYGESSRSRGGSGRTFWSVTHDLLGDRFWAVYRLGLRDAAVRFGCTVHHVAPRQFSAQAMAACLGRAVESGPDGIIATIPDPKVVEPPLRRARERGIPVIAVNAADRRPRDQRIPYLVYIGADDLLGGRAAGARLLRGGPRRRCLVVDHYLAENTSHVERRAGFLAAISDAHGLVETLRVPGESHERAVDLIRDRVRDAAIDAVLTLGPPGASAAIAALEAEGLTAGVAHGSFDLGPLQLRAIRDGRLLFTIDSQQYLQGYLGVALLFLHVEHGLLPASDVLTGPNVVDRQNVDGVAAAVVAGVR